ncbi:MAG TPA: hypothetical protein IAD07_04970 [Candidatus Fimivicinus intestinavium]|nr:hypothetical protein [Candidatus Fimivicinus intestinavium]
MPAEPQDRNIECLNKIYQGAKMGCESISFLTEKVTDANLLNDLHEQHDQYAQISCQASQALSQRKAVPKDKGPLAQASLWSGVQMNTMMDKSPNHIAEIMINGNTMGLIETTRTMKQYSDVQPEVQSLGQALIQAEETGIQKMKQYLS